MGNVHHQIPSGGLVIGRAPDSNVPLNDTLASRHHARIEMQGNVFMVTDLGSTNGTLVNGQRIQQPQPLHDGDEIRIGNSVMSFRCQYT